MVLLPQCLIDPIKDVAFLLNEQYLSLPHFKRIVLWRPLVTVRVQKKIFRLLTSFRCFFAFQQANAFIEFRSTRDAEEALL